MPADSNVAIMLGAAPASCLLSVPFVKAILVLLLATGCVDSASGIRGDTSPDDPATSPDETSQGKGDKPPQQITRGSGVVMDAPTVVHVYWGSYWSTDRGSSDRAVLDGFSAMVGGASWWTTMAEYPDANHVAGAPAFGAPVIVDTDPPAKLYAGDVALHGFLRTQLTSEALSYDAETLYMVMTPPGTTGVRGECGHHSYFSVNLAEGKRKVIYSIVPYLDDGDKACDVPNVDINGGALDSMTVTLAHEIAEAVSDPYLDGWMTSDGVEIADQCDTGVAVSWGSGRFAVQDLWSNAAFGCVHP